MTNYSLDFWGMYLEVHAWHLVFTASILHKLVNVGLSLFVWPIQYIIEVIIVFEEFWVLLGHKVQEILTIHLTSIDINIVELFGFYDSYSLYVPALYHNCLVLLVFVNHFLYDFGFCAFATWNLNINLFLLFNLWHLDKDNCLLISVLFSLYFNFLQGLFLTLSWFCLCTTFSWSLSWLHDLLDCVLSIDALWNIYKHYLVDNLIKFNVRRLNRHSLGHDINDKLIDGVHLLSASFMSNRNLVFYE